MNLLFSLARRKSYNSFLLCLTRLLVLHDWVVERVLCDSGSTGGMRIGAGVGSCGVGVLDTFRVDFRQIRDDRSHLESFPRVDDRLRHH